MAMKKVLGISALQGGGFEGRANFDTRLPVHEIRRQLRQTVQDCPGMDAQRLQFKLNAATSAHQLWMLRSDVYECIACSHNQTEAVRRINALLPCFNGWLPQRQLVRI